MVRGLVEGMSGACVAANQKWRIAFERTPLLRRPPRPSWMQGAPLRSPERSRDMLWAWCRASEPARGNPSNDDFRTFNQVLASGVDEWCFV